ncbi:DHHW family protein [Gracilibacillus salinarum]|uniref:DHHW family protein n=1 Tax=Gracilibacillus salinarum TaxID=2932255 RepID=A0ABY4GRM4_9BACI|nr:DHHW family protein [Gracilibacillus salinarum]UOQ87038.1 DHHW family protein [Gracilibacillus salinarum]
MNKTGKKILLILFITYIFIIGVYLVIAPKNKDSDVENRTLAQRPPISLEQMSTGEFMKNFEAFFTDQFPGRNVWLNMYINWQRLSNKTYIFDYYITDDNWIMPKPSKSFPQEKMDAATENTNAFAKYLKKQNINTYYISLPHKAATLEFLYPGYLGEPTYDKKNEYFLSQLNKDDMNVINVGEAFNEKSESELRNFYFKTDHHWNANGAFAAYTATVNQLKADNFLKMSVANNDLKKDAYEKQCIPDHKFFMGTYNKQIYASVKSNDSQNECVYLDDKTFSSYEVALNGESIDPYLVYASGLEDYDTKNNIYYGNIFSNDESKIKITNNANAQSDNVLIIKDSYTNALIYHIAQHFHETTIYDLRHNPDQSLKDYIANNNFDAVFIMYNNTQLTAEDMFNFD